MIKFILIIFFTLITPISFFSTLSLLLLLIITLSFYLPYLQEFSHMYQIFAWDTLSFSLIRLTFWIVILILLARLSNINIIKFKSSFILISICLLFILVLTFSVINLILFYILFEASLIPIFIIILGWGNQPERLQAGTYILLYTVFLSLPILIIFLLWSNTYYRTRFFLLNFSFISFSLLPNIIAYFLILAFSVKLPIYILHLWLPKAHVEAPVAGSIILAAILLKLGGYGILRISNKAHCVYYLIRSPIISWSLIGGLIISLLCLFQSDIKSLIALSSVAHMSLVISSILTFSNWGINRALFIIIGHGFCSSGLFCSANINYERLNSRSVYLLKGYIIFTPAFSILWFLLCTSNIATPPSLNFLGEITRIISIYSWSHFFILPIIIIVFMSATYSLFLFSQTQYSKPSSNIKPFFPISLREWLISFLHWVPLNLFFLCIWLIQIII